MLRLLLIDDNSDDRALALAMLSREFSEIKVEEITDSTIFAEVLARNEFDLVITEYQLPWTDGLSILRLIKKQWPSIPVIMFTGTDDQNIVIESMNLGLNVFLPKTSKSYINLANTVKTVLEQTESRRRSARMETFSQTLLDRAHIGIFR